MKKLIAIAAFMAVINGCGTLHGIRADYRLGDTITYQKRTHTIIGIEKTFNGIRYTVESGGFAESIPAHAIK